MAALERADRDKKTVMFQQLFHALKQLWEAGVPVAQRQIIVPQVDFKKADRDHNASVFVMEQICLWMADMAEPTNGRAKIAAYEEARVRKPKAIYASPKSSHSCRHVFLPNARNCM
jgi:hypothetical protein